MANLPHHESEPIGVPRGANPAMLGSDSSTRFARSVCQIKTMKVGTNWTQPYLNGQRALSAGTGFVIDHGGEKLVVTNDHVIRDARKIEVFFPQYGSQPFKVNIVADSPDGDLALLRLANPPTLDTLSIADSDHVLDGAELITVGFPLGQTGQKQSAGVKAGVQDLNGCEYLQTDAAINHGNSGGPLLRKSDYAVVGINNCIIEGKNNVGYALPSTSLTQFLGNYDYLRRDDGKPVRVSKPFFGFSTEKVDDSMLGYIGSSDKSGAMLSSVAPSSIFADMGLSEGDQLLSIGVGSAPRAINQFQEVSVDWSATPVSFERMLNRVKLGDSLNFEYYDYRKKKKKRGKYAYKKCAADPRVVRPLYTPFDAPKAKVVAGLVLQELNLNLVKLYMGLNPLLAKYASLKAQCDEPAVVVTHVLEGSVAESRGTVAPSMVLNAINDVPVSTFADIDKVLSSDPVEKYNKFDLHENVKLFVSNEEMVSDQAMLSEEYGHYFEKGKAELVQVEACACGSCGGGGHPAPSNPSGELMDLLPASSPSPRLVYEVGPQRAARPSKVVAKVTVDDFEMEALRRSLPAHLLEEYLTL